MTNKCTKFEGMFVFSNKDFDKHLEECEDCRIEKEKFDRISALIQEAKPLYFSRQSKIKKAMTAAVLFLAVLSGTLFTTFNYYSGIFDTIKYGETLSAEDYGFPVDSYGFILVDE